MVEIFKYVWISVVNNCRYFVCDLQCVGKREESGSETLKAHTYGGAEEGNENYVIVFESLI